MATWRDRVRNPTWTFSQLWKLLHPHTTLYVDGRFLYDVDGNRLILRGVNLPLLDDWNFPARDKLAEIEKTGANAVRLQWYVNYPGAGRPAYGLPDLDAILATCASHRMIPILDLHDATCQGDVTLLNTQLIPWWTRPDVVAVLQKHKKYLIVNLANELGNYRWSDDPAGALTAYRNAYQTAIASIRAAGLDMPVMIDAPDCGTSIHAFTNVGQQLIAGDPSGNVLLSAHAYWAALPYDGPAEITKVINAGLPLVLGEVANKQSDQGDECYYDLDGSGQGHAPKPAPGAAPFTYQALLTLLAQQDVGWLSWCWWKDDCASRQMTGTGNYADLTSYGLDLVDNPFYGLRLGIYHAIRSPTLP